MKRIIPVFIAMVIVASPIIVFAENDEVTKSFTETKEYTTRADEGKWEKQNPFKDAVVRDGKIYRLKDVTYEVQSESDVFDMGTDTITVDSE